jgi:hypothetical protein
LYNFESPLPKDVLCQVWLKWFVPSSIEIGLMVLKKILKSFQWIFTLLLLSPFGGGGGFP